MPSYSLTDLSEKLPKGDFAVGSTDLGRGVEDGPAWSVSRRTLRGGRREGVELVEIDNGALAVSIVPTRGLGIWRGEFAGDRIGWDSPVRDGPVHPAWVNLSSRGGLGWLAGFDELMVRCGLSHNGPPYQDASTLRTLHGKIANLAAHSLTIEIDDEAPFGIAVEGEVDEAELFSTAIRLKARFSTEPGSNRLTIRDEFTNLGDTSAAMQVLYHWNFGPPHLEAGSRLVAPVRIVCPRDSRAAEGVANFADYGPPEPGSTEQAYFCELIGDDAGQSLVILRNRAGNKGVSLRFSTRSLPCFTLWKNLSGMSDGYVTGLEPGTNYPNARPFEEARGRVVSLEPGGRFVAETTLEILDGADRVAAAEREVLALQERAAPTIEPAPVEPFAAVS